MKTNKAIVRCKNGRVNITGTERVNGMGQGTLHMRLRSGMTFEEALEKPLLEMTGITLKNGKKSGEFQSWQNAKQRTTNPNNPRWSKWGGRGIRICERWANSFKVFLKDMGLKPEPDCTIDRIDNDGHYSCGDHDKCWECWIEGWPMNCRWATHTEQANNKSTNIYVDTPLGRRTFAEACRMAEIDYYTARDRVRRRGISPEEAIFNWRPLK